MTPDPVYELHIEEKKCIISEGVHVLFIAEESKRYNTKSKRNETKLSQNVTIKTFTQSLENGIASGMQALLCASSTNLTITDLNSALRTQINSRVLQPFVNNVLKNNDKISVGSNIITVNVKSTDITSTDDSGISARDSLNIHDNSRNESSNRDCFWSSNDKSPPLISQNHFVTPNRIPLLNNAKKIITPSIHDALTQNFVEPDIHEIATQNFDIYEVATQQFIVPSVSNIPTKNAKDNIDPEDDIIQFDDFTEDPMMEQSSQNLLDDYGVGDICNRMENSDKIKAKIIEDVFDDDCSTDMEDDIDILNNLSEKLNVKNIPKDISAPATSINDMETQDPFDIPTQILPQDDNNLNKLVTEEVIFTQKKLAIKEEILTQSNNDLDDLFDAPTQIIESSVHVSNIHTMDTQFDDLPETQILDTEKFIKKTSKSFTNMLPPALPNKSSDKLKNNGIYKELNKENLDLTLNLTQSLAVCLNESVVEQASSIGCDKPFYNLTQDVMADLSSSQISPIAIQNTEKTFLKKSTENKNKSDDCFATPLNRNKKINTHNTSIANQDVSIINDTPQNYYNCTQDLLTDLLSQKKFQNPSPSYSNKYPPSKLINVFENIKEFNINSDCPENEFKIPSSQNDAIGDRYPHINSKLNRNELSDKPSTSKGNDDDFKLSPLSSPFKLFNTEIVDPTEMCTPKKMPNRIISMELPDSQEIQRHVSRYSSHVTIPESPAESESAEDSDTPIPIVFKRKIPTKRKNSASPQKRISNRIKNRKNDTDNTSTNSKTSTRKSSNEPKITNANKRVSKNTSRSDNVTDVSTAKNTRKRGKNDHASDVLEKKSRVSSLLQHNNMSYPFNVMFTQINIKKLFDAVEILGGEVVQTKGDVLVVQGISRTFKTLMAISQGIPIVTKQWLEDSMNCYTFLDPSNYLIEDLASEKKYNYNLKTVLNSKRNYLKGWTVYITPNVLPEPVEMKQLIEINGGKCIVCKSCRTCRNVENSDTTFSVLCHQDKNLQRHLPTPHMNVEVILSGILKQNLDLELYKFKS